jgi:electron transfer flavoprotein beta subunit
MAAKRKPLTVHDLAALGVDPQQVGLRNSGTEVVEISARPPRQAGAKVTDDGSGAVGAKALVDFLVARKFI